jgi:glycosyltransferase involved in cell wall biosynthesis
MINFWEHCDGIICIGEFQTELAKALLPVSHHKRIFTIFNGIQDFKYDSLKRTNPNLNSNNIIFIANISSQWRIRYKGLDLLLEAFILSLQSIPDLTLTIVGEISPEIQESINIKYIEFTNKIIFPGHVVDIHNYFADSSLYIHPARGEAWGMTVAEAMLSGLPSIVSNVTGTKEIISRISDDFIVPLDSVKISEKIIWFLNLSLDIKQEYSRKMKEIMTNYTEEKAKERFLEVFNKIANE